LHKSNHVQEQAAPQTISVRRDQIMISFHSTRVKNTHLVNPHAHRSHLSARLRQNENFFTFFVINSCVAPDVLISSRPNKNTQAPEIKHVCSDW
jgi:hypothetical protein